MGLLDYLPDDPDKKEAMRQGLLQFGAAMLGGHGNFGQMLGQGIGAGAQGYQGQLQAQQQRQLSNAQLERWNLENQQTKAAIAEPGIIAGILHPESAPQQPSAASALAGGASTANVQPQPLISTQPAGGVLPLSALPVAGAQPGAAQPTPPPASQYATLMSYGDKLSAAGKDGAAKKYYDMAKSVQQKYSTEFRVAQGGDGKLHNYMVAEDGSFKDTGLGVKPDMVESDLGGKKVWSDKNAIQPGASFAKTVTPGEALQSADQAKSRAQSERHFQTEQAAAPEDAPMDPLAVRMTAQQYLAGDAGALQNFGRGAQGAKNLNAVRLEVAKQANAAGMNGGDIAAKMAEFAGMKAGQRTAGIRSASIEIAANEVAQLAPIALDASAKVTRSGFLPFGKAQIMFDSNTNDPNMRQFAMANTALVNAYGQAMARGGAATVSDKDHARELLSTTFDQKSYAAAVAQLQKETRAAQAAPKQVRKDLSDAVSGRESSPGAAPTAYSDADKERRYQAYVKAKAGK
jgi:hypothetical protein